jgi:hypothetical protein
VEEPFVRSESDDLGGRDPHLTIGFLEPGTGSGVDRQFGVDRRYYVADRVSLANLQHVADESWIINARYDLEFVR